MVDLSELNNEQRDAALSLGNTLTIAAPGSGKTKMLSTKAAFLLEQGKRVVAVTFTRDSALELLERTVKTAGEECLPRLLVGTFHSINMLMCFPSRSKSGLGREILSQAKSSFKAPWKLVSESDRRSYIDRAVSEAKMGITVEEASSLIERMKAGDLVPDSDDAQRMWDVYAECLQRHGNIDFLDILLLTNQGIKAGDVSTLQTDYLLLDEFQDTDRVQYEWMSLHINNGVSCTVVGDDDQSIYGFRRALGFAGMKQFESDFNAHTIVLGKNYRSHAEVLCHADALINKNGDGRMAKSLVSNKGPGGNVEWEKFISRDLEAQACALAAQQAVRDGCTFAILSRTNKRLDPVQAELVKIGVPHERAKDSGSFFDHPPVSAVVAAVGCLLNPDDRKAADKVLGWCGVANADLKMIYEKVWGVASIIKPSALDKIQIDPDTRKRVRDVAVKLSEMRSVSPENNAEWMALTLAPLLKRSASAKGENELIDLALGIFKSETSSMRAQYERIDSKMNDSKASKDKSPTAPVQLMTAHSSKGLEYDRVWIVGAEDGAFPGTSAQVDEERRLMYVAITRARKSLVVSAAGVKQESPFIAEAQIARAVRGKYQTHPLA